MRNIILIFFTLLYAGIFTGCQQTDTLEPDTAFREKIVIFANLREGKTMDGVQITKTLPLSVTYDIKLAEIKDATVYIKENLYTVIPLTYDSAGIYKTLHPLTIHAGSTYELFATVGVRKYYAKTYIPFSPKISEAHLIDDKYIQATIGAKANEVYGVAWVIPGAKEWTFFGAATDFQEISDPGIGSSKTSVSLRTIDIPNVYRDPQYLRTAVAKPFAFDMQYYNYFKTKSNNQQTINSFTQGSGQTMWNIVGEDVIGLFMGTAEGPSFKPN